MNAEVPTERSTLTQLTTARLILAQFKAQIGEWESMGEKRRRRSVRGRDLGARIGGLHKGHAKWTQRVADLEAKAAAEAGAEAQTQGQG
ncbi:hypothetical protein [Microbacterium sp. MMO-10]|uniref:hypothetical protein n=1 Tax=Microbacterium sp. MMO-10 TaxID=3081272 RepID=UPI003019C5C8